MPINPPQPDDGLVERLTHYHETLATLTRGVPMDPAQKLANVTPKLAAEAFRQSAHRITTLSERVAELERMAGVAMTALREIEDGPIDRFETQIARAALKDINQSW